MALRYKIPAGTGAFEPKTELAVPPIMRKPAVVEFRKGGDMAKIAAEIRQHVSVQVCAAPGAGKSTLLPKDLALAYKSLVFHVVPNEVLAYDLHSYVGKCADLVGGYPPLELFSSYEQVYPQVGVVFMSSAQFVGLMIRESGLGKFKDCVVFLDEAHESDAYTHVVRNLSLPLGAGMLVQASATFGAGDFRPRETDGELVECTYDAELIPETWDPLDSKKPWGFARLNNNMLVFTDSRSQYVKIAAAYEPAGFLVHRLEAGMDTASYASAMADLKNARGPLVVLVADYSFRSGFTFNVGAVFDTARVAYYDPRPGALIKKSRRVFQFELEQAANRGARVAGLRTVFYKPDLEYESIRCELEGVEMEAAAYLYRVLGYKPVRELSVAVMAKYNLPVGVSFEVAMNGVYPLTYYVVDSKGGIRKGSVLACDAISSDESVSRPDIQDASPSSREREPTLVGSEEDEGDLSSVLGAVDSVSSSSAASERVQDELWAAVTGVAEGEKMSVELGELCTVRGLGGNKDGVVVSSTFPGGLESVIRMFGPGKRLPSYKLSPDDRVLAMRLVLNRYNVCTLEKKAGTMALLGRAAEIVEACRSEAAREYFSMVVEALASYDIESSMLRDIMDELSTSALYAEALREAEGYVEKRAREYEKEFEGALRSPQYDDGYVKADLSEAVRGLPLGGGLLGRASGRYGRHERHRGRRVEFGSRDGVLRESAGGVGDDGQRRRSGSTRDGTTRPSSPSGGMITIKPPRWMGMKSVTYTASVDGKVSEAIVRPGSVLRKVFRYDREVVCDTFGVSRVV